MFTIYWIKVFPVPAQRRFEVFLESLDYLKSRLLFPLVTRNNMTDVWKTNYSRPFVCIMLKMLLSSLLQRSWESGLDSTF